jgi:hypothetical protein
MKKGYAPVAADREAPPKGGDGTPGPYGNVGGYNNFWLDPGSSFTVVDGRKRASLLIDPPDGRVPPMRPEARERNARRAVLFTSDSRANEDDPGFEGPEAYNDPEQRPLGERCLVGFSSTSGPPILPTYFYNNLHQIVQTPTQIVILTEMVHDARVIRMNDKHLPPRFANGSATRSAAGKATRWLSTPPTSPTRRASADPPISCTSSNVSPGTDAASLRYQFTIDDPTTWERRGPVSTPGRSPKSGFTNTRATRAITQ